MFNFLKRKSKLNHKNEELKYYCDKCSKELSFEMYQSKKCFWCESKHDPIVVKEVDKSPKTIKDLNQMLIEHNWKSIDKYNQRKEVKLKNGTNRKKKKSVK